MAPVALDKQRERSPPAHETALRFGGPCGPATTGATHESTPHRRRCPPPARDLGTGVPRSLVPECLPTGAATGTQGVSLSSRPAWGRRRLVAVLPGHDPGLR